MNDQFVRLHSMRPVADRSVRVDIEIAGDRFEDTIFEEAVSVGDVEIPRLRDSGLLDRLQTLATRSEAISRRPAEIE